MSKRSRKVRIILGQLDRLRIAAQEEVIRSQGGLPLQECLNCHWTAQAGGKVLGVESCIQVIRELFPE